MCGRLYLRLVVVVGVIISAWSCTTCLATEWDPLNNGSLSFAWPTSSGWTALSGINDGVDNIADPQLDFVGDSSNPGGYWAQDSKYIYFRMRVDVGTVDPTPNTGTFTDAVTVLIDRVGYGNENGLPDFGFSWDSKSNSNANHGLEMQVFSASANGRWGGVTMDDFDSTAGSKVNSKSGVNDINYAGASRTPTDGFVRVTDQVSTTNFDTTSLIDIAVSWNYLTLTAQPTGLGYSQTWKVTFGSIHNATDHNVINYDVAGGANLTSLVTAGWSGNLNTTPEPATWVLTSLGATGFLAFRRWRKKKEPEEASECETP